jgi:hypothetical protein
MSTFSVESPSDRPIRIAILDDYQHVALKCADFGSILSRANVDIYDTTEQAVRFAHPLRVATLSHITRKTNLLSGWSLIQ